ncbi:MAG: hypothetical protein JWN75_341 [Candidatus Saccharibacteria bacterium]|nr:hypothetical protein [Candidatus Saccharibacteria bacterium]
MINLLPDDTKRDIRAARMNVVLVRYMLLTLGALAALVAFCGLFFVILQTTQSKAVTTNVDNGTKAASFSAVRKSADEYRNNLSVASKILDNSVNYTSVIFEITKLLPSGVILDNLTLTAADFGQQTSFSVHAKSYDKATELKKNFQDSKLFTNVFFQNLTDGTSTDSKSTNKYPIAVTISAKLNKVAG